VTNSFGVASSNENNTFIHKSEIPIEIEYKDVYGHKYMGHQILVIKKHENFAGSGWSKENLDK